MKKPNFIEIRLPGRESTFSSAKTKYFSRLVGKVLNINFGERKERKLFEYTVKESHFCEKWWQRYRKESTYWSIKLKLKVPREDLDKVL